MCTNQLAAALLRALATAIEEEDEGKPSVKRPPPKPRMGPLPEVPMSITTLLGSS